MTIFLAVNSKLLNYQRTNFQEKKRIPCSLIFQFFEIVFIVFEQVALKNCFGNILESKLKKWRRKNRSQNGQIPRTKMDSEFQVNMQIYTFVYDTLKIIISDILFSKFIGDALINFFSNILILANFLYLK